MPSSLHIDEESSEDRLSRQAVSFFVHTLLALGIWLGMMLMGYAMNPPGVSQWVVLFMSVIVPLICGYFITRFRQEDMATAIWLVGLIWVLIVSLWILDMPTGPNECFQCSATEKLTRTFFSLPTPSGLIDNDGPFLGTWPAAALIGYSIGAKMGMKKKAPTD